jgi:undecaprenyl-diphosphatase
MIDVLNNIDVNILYWVNSHHSNFLDQVMVFASGKLTWVVFYLFLLFLIIKKYKYKAVLAVLFIAIAITLSDQASVRLFKNVFLRLRPCHQPDVMENLRMIIGCGGRYGFVSSHAANSFALVAFIILLLQKRWVSMMMIIWGTLIIYSRVYLGVHYPSDVIAGSMVGIIAGGIAFGLFFITEKKWRKKLTPDI